MSNELRIVTNYRGVMAVIAEAAKNKGVRFNVSDFEDGDIECLNKDVVIFRGKADDFLHSLFQGLK